MVLYIGPTRLHRGKETVVIDLESQRRALLVQGWVERRRKPSVRRKPAKAAPAVTPPPADTSEETQAPTPR